MSCSALLVVGGRGVARCFVRGHLPGIYFLGHHRVHNQRYEMILTPLTDDARFNFRAGESEPASGVFRSIRESAQDTPDYPG